MLADRLRGIAADIKEVNMAYSATKPADDQYIAQGPSDMRENFRALKEDQIVDAGKLSGKSSDTAATANTIVARDASGNIAAANIVTTPTAGKLLVLNGDAKVPADITGAAAKLATSRTISLSGDATGTANFDGTANAAITLALASSGVAAGTYHAPDLSVDAKGRITAASQGVAGFSAATFPAGGVLASAMFVIPYACTLTTIDIKSTKKDSIAAVTPGSSTTISIYKNGSSYYSKAITAASTTDTTASLSFAAGDTVQILQSAINSTEVITLTARGVRS